MSEEQGHSQLEPADQPILCGRCGFEITGGGAGKLCAICLRIWEQTRVPRENWWISSSSQWFVRRGDRQLGPYALAALCKLAVDGKLRVDDLVWTEGVMEWRRADRIHGLLLPPLTVGTRPAAEIRSAVKAAPIAAVSTAAAAPVIAAAAPVITARAPVIAAPAPVTAAPAPVITAPTPVITARAPVTAAPAPVITAPAPVITARAPVIAAPKPVIAAPKPVVAAPKPVVAAPRSSQRSPRSLRRPPRSIAAPAPVIAAPTPVIAARTPAIAAPKPAIATPAPAIAAPAPVIAPRTRVIAAPATVIAAPRTARPNYFVRHWRGQLPLPVSYWVNWLLVSALLAVGVLSAKDPALLERLGTNAGSWELAVAASALAAMAWQSVGLWRSAERYVVGGGRREWATLAKVCVGIGLLPVVGSALEQLPAVQQALDARFRADRPRVTQLYVAKAGTEIEIAGGLSPGIATALSSTLDRTPTIRVVRLANAGGSISEAHKLAGLIAARDLVTFAPHECDGACLLAFLGGKLRYMGLGGRLGFYGASVAGTGGAGEKRNQLFREVMLARGVPTAFIAQALAAPDSHPWYPTTSELLQANVITGIADDPEHAAQEFDARARLEADFLTVPVFAVLRRLEPDTFAQLKETYVSGVLGGVPRNEMNAKLHAAIMEKVIPKYVRIAPDHELVAYWRTQLDKARELRAIDPKYCAQFLTPQPGVDTSGLAGLFSQKVQDEDIQALANLIRAGAEHPGRVPPGSEVREALRASARRADALIPGAVDIVANPQTASTLPREFCGAEVAFYESILALPPAQAGPLLRFLVAQG
jgi:GYF domain 2